MCGIAGIYHFERKPVQVSDLKKMTDAIRHRGPDGEGHWASTNGHVGFGHRRLSIIDLSENGRQPMQYADGRYTITFNGEIYNYVELKTELVQKGYRFISDSDTEVLLALYDLKGEACLQDLDGMFAFAIWDEKEQVFFCARDRFGEKPFFYTSYQGAFYFASEMKAFWSAGIPKQLNNRMLDLYIRYQAVQDSEDATTTFYQSVYQLDAGHYIKITQSGQVVKQQRYWDLNTVRPVRLSLDQATERFYDLFKESVSLRLRSDVPVGSSLSGGLDSSSIVMMIDELKSSEAVQKTFSARFKDFAKDEGEHIEKVIKACKRVESHYVWPDGEEMLQDLDKLSCHQEEPFGSASIYAQWKVMELARQHDVTVLLDGQGADEQLGGYLTYYGTYLKQLFYHDSKKYKPELNAYNSYHQNAWKLGDLHDTETFRMKLGRIQRQILSRPMPVAKDALQQRLIYDTQISGLKTLLRYADRNSMAHSREVRLPFLSHRLVEFIFSLPDEYKLNSGWTKYILRKAMDTMLPKDICWRVDKVGYEPPQAGWMKHEKVIRKAAQGKAKLKDHIPEAGQVSDWQLLMLDTLL